MESSGNEPDRGEESPAGSHRGRYRGQLVIGFIVVVALAMSGYAWWHQLQAGRRSTEFWGQSPVILIRYAPQVEFFEIQPARSGDAARIALKIRGVPFLVGKPIDITHSRGMVHVRHALLDDLSFDWNAGIPGQPEWEFLLRFRDGNQQLTAVFDVKRGVIGDIQGSQSLQLIPKISAAFRKKQDEWRKRAIRQIEAPAEPAPSQLDLKTSSQETVPSPLYSGEKVAARPDEGASRAIPQATGRPRSPSRGVASDRARRV